MDRELHEQAQTILRLHQRMRWGELIYGVGMICLALQLWPDVSKVGPAVDAGSLTASAGIAGMMASLGFVAVLNSLLKWRGDGLAREIVRRWELHSAPKPDSASH